MPAIHCHRSAHPESLMKGYENSFGIWTMKKNNVKLKLSFRLVSYYCGLKKKIAND